MQKNNKSKKALALNVFISLFVLLSLIIAIINIVKVNNDLGSFGDLQIKILDKITASSEIKSYLDKSIKSEATDLIVNLSMQGLVDNEACYKYRGLNLWNTNQKQCFSIENFTRVFQESLNEKLIKYYYLYPKEFIYFEYNFTFHEDNKNILIATPKNTIQLRDYNPSLTYVRILDKITIPAEYSLVHLQEMRTNSIFNSISNDLMYKFIKLNQITKQEGYLLLIINVTTSNEIEVIPKGINNERFYSYHLEEKTFEEHLKKAIEECNCGLLISSTRRNEKGITLIRISTQTN